MPIAISPEVHAVLKASTLTPSSLQLPLGRLDRKLYLAVMDVIEAAGGKWDKKRALHTFDQDPREKLGLALSTGRIVSKKHDLQAFYTPADVATKLVTMAGVKRGSVVLEPSAGAGAIVSACIHAGVRAPDITAIDIDTDAIDTLVSLGVRALARDFLEYLDPAAVCSFDAVVMNPPFTRGQDVRHVTHALRFPSIGGTLVAAMPAGWETRRGEAVTILRAALANSYEHVVEPLPDGSFKASGTAVRTCVLAARRIRA